MTISEKILARAAGKDEVKAGDIIDARVDLTMSHEGTAGVIQKFLAMGGEEVWDNRRMVVLMDHWAPAHTEQMAEMHREIRRFCKAQGIVHFYDIFEGICHQVLPEKGHIVPGELVVGTDSHTTTYGAFGCFSTGIGTTEMAAVFLEGKIWLKVPSTIRFTIEGDLPEFVTSKDIILWIAGEFGTEVATYKAVEFSGETVSSMTISERMTLTNMAVELGAKTGLVKPDYKVVEYLRGRTTKEVLLIDNDADAIFEDEHKLTVNNLRPQVACPHNPGNVKPVDEVSDIRINQAFIGGCTNGRLEDIAVAAKIIKGHRIPSDVRLIIIPASREVYQSAMQQGLLQTLLEAGGIICHPTCGPCIGAQLGLLASGEVCIATTNRNFRGRMGSQEAEIYLASPAVVAASAVAGRIIAPEEVV